MKKSLQVLMVLLALGIAFGGATVTLGQQRVPIVGGFKEAATDDPEVVAAAEYAIRAQNEKEGGSLTLVSIAQAEYQVVAGMNYRLCLKVMAEDETDADVDANSVQVVVYKKLTRQGEERKYELRSWVVRDCVESESEQSHATPPRAAGVSGVYENFTIGKESGDLEGMRVVIVSAGNGYHAIVQIAQGGAEDPQPEFVEVTVKGMNVEFTSGSEKFTGRVTDAGLTLKDSSGAHQLKRKPCSAYFMN